MVVLYHMMRYGWYSVLLITSGLALHYMFRDATVGALVRNVKVLTSRCQQSTVPVPCVTVYGQ